MLERKTQTQVKPQVSVATPAGTLTGTPIGTNGLYLGNYIKQTFWSLSLLVQLDKDKSSLTNLIFSIALFLYVYKDK